DAFTAELPGRVNICPSNSKRAIAVSYRRYIDVLPGFVHALLNPCRTIEIACPVGVRWGQGFRRGQSKRWVRTRAENVVPECMQHVSAITLGARYLFGIPAFVTIRFCSADARDAMQRLMYVARDMKQPGQVVRLQIVVSRRRGQDLAERRNLRFSVRGRNWGQFRAISRERDIDKVPVAMLQLVLVPNVLRRCRSLREVAAGAWRAIR